MPEYEDLMTYLQQQQAQRKATGMPTWSIPELQEVGRGVTRAREEAVLGREALAERRRESDIATEEAEKTRRAGQITGAVQTAESIPMTYAAYKYYTGGGAAKGPGAVPGATPGTATPGVTPAVSGEMAAGGPEAMGTTAGPMATQAPGFFTEAGGMTTVGGAGLAGGVAGAYAPLPKGAIPFGGAKEKAVTGGVVAGAGAGAITGAAMTSWSGPGAIIGTIVGGIAGGLSAYLKTKKKVICTELLRQGFIAQELLDIEHKYDPLFDWEVYFGYRTWADTVVKWMQDSKMITFLVAMIAIPFLKEIAHRVEPSRKGSLLGTLVLQIGMPMCRSIFRRKVQSYRKAYIWQQKLFEKVGE